MPSYPSRLSCIQKLLMVCCFHVINSFISYFLPPDPVIFISFVIKDRCLDKA